MKIGHIEAIFRYPVKSMRGERLDAVNLGWHGIDGDRRFALHRIGDCGAFPWLTAGKFPELVLFSPTHGKDGAQVRTPDGQTLPVFSTELAAEVERRCGNPVEMMQSKNGIFDDAAVSVIAAGTVEAICGLAGITTDVRRFRPNILIRLLEPAAFQEDSWMGHTLLFGEGGESPAVAVTERDVRCAMLNIDPDSAALNPEVMKAVVRANGNNAGLYGAVIRTGQLSAGQPVFLSERA